MTIANKTRGKTVSGKAQIAGVTGAVTGTGVTVIEGMGEIHQSVFNLSGTALTGTDNSGLYYAQAIYTCPAGKIVILGGTADFSIVGSDGVATSGSGAWGVGTEACDSGNALAGAEQDIIPTTAYTLSVYEADCAAGNTAIINSGAPYDGTSTETAYYLNLTTTSGSFTTTGTITVTGTVTLSWLNLGDY